MEEVIDILQTGVREGVHPGAQIFVARAGETLLDYACGEARPDMPMTTDSIVQWFSTGKPLTAILVAMLHERGLLDIMQPAARHIPEFAAHGKAPITFWHLLTHTAGFRSADKIPPSTPWDEMITRICDAPLEENWEIGRKAGYSTAAGWYILAETVQRVTGHKFDEYIKTELLEPLRMDHSWLRLPSTEFRTHASRLALMYNTAGSHREELPLQDAEGLAICRPGASARGPVKELANFYRMLLDGGVFFGKRLLQNETVEWLARRHREGLFDHTFMHRLDFGLGFVVNSSRYGPATVPYGYGIRASEDAFGHSGAQSSCAFADPARKLVVAWVTTGLPGEREHQARQRALNEAIYRSFREAGT